MKGSRPSTSGKFWTFLLLTAGLSSMGATYGAWTAKQTAVMQNKTGAFLMALSDSEDCRAYMVTEDEDILAEIDGISLDLSGDRRKGTLRLDQDIPVGELLTGTMLQMVCRIEPAKAGTFGQVQPVEPDFTTPMGILELKSHDHKNDSDYGVKKLEFYLYQGLEWEDEELYGSIWLRLTPDAALAIQDLPPAIVKEDTDNEAVTDPAISEDSQDVVVCYTGSITIPMDQYGAPIESPYIANAYWTDQLTLTCELLLSYPAIQPEEGMDGFESFRNFDIPLVNDLIDGQISGEGGGT